MAPPRFQFSLAALLLTVAVVAGDLALMFQVASKPAQVVLIFFVIALTALGLTGAINGPPTWRTFCIGALVPLGIMVVKIATSINAFIGNLATFSTAVAGYNQFFGYGILASIAIGYLCVAAQWVTTRHELPDA